MDTAKRPNDTAHTVPLTVEPSAFCWKYNPRVLCPHILVRAVLRAAHGDIVKNFFSKAEEAAFAGSSRGSAANA